MEEIMDYIIRFAAVAVVAVIAWAVKKIGSEAVKLIKAQLNAEQEAQLDKFINELTTAADQMFKEIDPTGEIRMDYVKDMLFKAGVELTEAVMAKIESHVYKLPHGNKEAGEDQ